MPSKVFLDCKDDSGFPNPSASPSQEQQYLFIESPGTKYNNFTPCLQLRISGSHHHWVAHPRIQPWVRTNCSFQFQRRCRRPFEYFVGSQSIFRSGHVWPFQLRCRHKSARGHRVRYARSFEKFRIRQQNQGIRRPHQHRVVLKSALRLRDFNTLKASFAASRVQCVKMNVFVTLQIKLNLNTANSTD